MYIDNFNVVEVVVSIEANGMVEIRKKKMPIEEIVTRVIFGFLLVGASFFSWGKWVSLSIGILFILSASQNFCLSCYLSKLFQPKNSSNCSPSKK